MVAAIFTRVVYDAQYCHENKAWKCTRIDTWVWEGELLKPLIFYTAEDILKMVYNPQNCKVSRLDINYWVVTAIVVDKNTDMPLERIKIMQKMT